VPSPRSTLCTWVFLNPICQPKTKAPTATAVAMMMDSIMSQAVLDLKL
jgi:hypothetical protein